MMRPTWIFFFFWWCFNVSPSSSSSSSSSSSLPVVAFVPLDERFATRGLFLNLAKVAGKTFQIATPPMSMLTPSHAGELVCHRRLAGRGAADGTVRDHIRGDVRVRGLITSRESNTTTADVEARAGQLTRLKRRFRT